MLNVSDAVKKIYRMNMLPKGTKADIQGKIVFGDLGITIGNDRVVKDSFRLTESISENGDLDFGSTNASVVEFTVADVPEDLNGQTFVVTQIVNGTYTVPLGYFTVDSCRKQDNLRFKDIVAYDNMQKFNVNVAEWYKTVPFPVTLKYLRESLCIYCGVEDFAVDLVNDNIRVDRTLETNDLNGKQVLRWIAELNGSFAHINRYGNLTFLDLDFPRLYPSEKVFPSNNLFPNGFVETVEKNGTNAIAYISSKYEDYTASSIDGVIVLDDENDDCGLTVGEAENPYVLAGNMLIAGMSGEELRTVAENLLSKIGKIVYTPHSTESIGLPYIEVGDTILNTVVPDKLLLITKRVLTGLSSVMDNFSADGNQKRENNNTVDSVEVIRLKGISTKITREIGRIGVEIENFETETNTKFEVMDGEIASKVEKGNIISEINQSPEAVTIDAKKINLNGYVSINQGFSIDEYGNALLQSGEATARMTDNAFYIGNYLYGTAVKPGTIGMEDRTNKRLVEILGLYNNGSSTSVIIGNKDAGEATFHLQGYDVDAISGNFIMLSTSTLTCNAINGATPITASNVSNYVPTSTSDLAGDFREGSNGTYVALSNSSGNKYLATTEWVINYVTSKLG